MMDLKSDRVRQLASWNRHQAIRLDELEALAASLSRKVEYRELGPDEFHLAPREVPGSEDYTPENSRIIAGIDGNGEVVATFTLFLCPHLEPVWIREDHRHSATIPRRLAEAMKALLREIGCPNAYTVVLNKTPVLHRFARFFGFAPVDGSLYFWRGKA